VSSIDDRLYEIPIWCTERGIRLWDWSDEPSNEGETNGGGQATGHIKEVSNSNDEDMVT
jgi:hypothetical protein